MASSGTVTVTTDPQQCAAQITNKASFDNTTYTPQNPITPIANNCAPPAASFTVSSPTTVGTPVSFDGIPSTDPNPGGSITGYRWNFGDGSAGSGAMVSHTYTASGTYSVMLTVTDAEGGTNSTTHLVTVTGGSTGLAPVNTALPQISGTPTDGNTLTASTGTWKNDPTSFDYQWLDCTPGGCIPALNGHDSEFSLSENDRGKQIEVEVTAHNPFGSTSATSAPTAPVTQTVPVTVGGPTTTGDTATVPIQCQGGVDANCALLILLTALGGGSGHAGDVATAATPRKPHPKPVILGTTKVKIPGGHTKHVRITLNQAGRRLLAKKHVLKVKLTITEAGKVMSTRTIVFRQKHH